MVVEHLRFMPDAVIRNILDSLYGHYRIIPDPEITLESNPDDMMPERLAAWKDMGINRLSIGVQSFFSEDLVWMNRAHSAEQAIQAVEQTIKTGFNQFSLDLIYGTPGLTDKKWKKNLETAISFNTPHLSCYALTVEPKTALYKMIRMKKSADIQPEKQAAQFLTGIDILESAGYEHYEISSFARPGNRSRHNSAYWQSRKYLGLGPSAHSFNGSSRQWNVSNNALYIKSLMSGGLHFESEKLRPKDMLNEYIMTSLRTKEGLDLRYVADHFGEEMGKKLEIGVSGLYPLRSDGKTPNRLVLTKNGKLFADGIAAALFFD